MTDTREYSEENERTDDAMKSDTAGDTAGNDGDMIQAEGPDVETSTTESAGGGDGITEQTGEYGTGVDWDTGANVGDTGTPALDQKETQQRVNDELDAGGDGAQ